MLAEKERVYKEPIIEKKSKKNIKSKTNKSTAKNKNNLFISIGSICCFLLVISVLIKYVKVTELKSKISKIENEIVELEVEKNYLEASIEEIKSLSKIENKAKVNLGMNYPREDQFVYINMGEKQALTKETEANIFKTIFNSIFNSF